MSVYGIKVECLGITVECSGMNGVFRDEWGVQGRRQVLRRRGCYKVGFREVIQGESKKV